MSMWILLGIVSALGSALVIIFDKRGTRYIDSAVLGLIQSVSILLVLLAVQLYANGWAIFKGLDWDSAPYILAGSLCTGISYVCYYLIITYTSATRASALQQLAVVFSIYLAMVFLGEDASWLSLIGSLFIVTGMGFMVL